LTQKTNPAVRTARRVRDEVNGFAPIASDHTAASVQPQASIIIARKYRLEPVIARLVCHLAGIGLEART
jgi:hypothetical protein